VWLAAGVLAVLVAGLIVFLVNRPDETGGGDDTAASSPASSPAATSSQAPPTTSAQTQASDPPATSSQAPTTSAAAADPLSAENIEAFLQSYHEQAVADPRGTYRTLTGPTLQAAISENGYANYYGQFSDVNVSDVDAADGQTTATGTLEWIYTDGRSESATRLFTFIERNGELILDSETDP
jgi:hypothetical protein